MGHTILHSFNIAAKGEHILLREYAFISATQYNRKSFLQQVNKVFHSTPFFTVVTALDYHQLLCLLCSDFPRSIILEAIRVMDYEKPSQNTATTTAPDSDTDPMFLSFKLSMLQKSVAIFFYYFGTIE